MLLQLTRRFPLFDLKSEKLLNFFVTSFLINNGSFTDQFLTFNKTPLAACLLA